MAYGFQSTLAAYCGEGRILLHTQEFINSALAVTSVCVCVSACEERMTAESPCGLEQAPCGLFLWPSEGSSHISAHSCR